MDDTPFERLINIQSYSDEELKTLADRLADGGARDIQAQAAASR